LSKDFQEAKINFNEWTRKVELAIEGKGEINKEDAKDREKIWKDRLESLEHQLTSWLLHKIIYISGKAHNCSSCLIESAQLQ
jgi:hypothetical protein